MPLLKDIEREKQVIARAEQSLALERLKKRKADTRRKIELGGLVVKSGMEAYDKAVVLGALAYSIHLIKQNLHYENVFKAMGEKMFLD